MNSNQMYCYVCYFDYDKEGSFQPEKVFWYEKNAKEWVAKEGSFAKYKRMEIE